MPNNVYLNVEKKKEFSYSRRVKNPNEGMCIRVHSTELIYNSYFKLF